MNAKPLGFLTLFLFPITSLFSSQALPTPREGKNTTFAGTVYFPDSLSYPYSVTINQGATPIVSKNFSVPNFSVTTNGGVTGVVITSMGFEPQNIPVEPASLDTVTLSPVYLEEMSHILNEVAVTAEKAVIRNRGMNYSVSNIKGSYIGNAGNLIDMLSWTPGISVTNGETVSVLGRGGNPLIYVNGVKVLDQSELRSLTSSNVDKIEIIREPGAEYPVGTSSVILITTSKPLGEMINGEVSENAVIRRAFSDKVMATTFGRIKRVSFNASLAYGLNQSRQSSDYLLETFSDEPAVGYSQSLSQSTRNKNNSFSWFVGANYVTDKKSVFLLQYSGTSGDNKDRFLTHRTVSDASGVASDQYSTYSTSGPTRHNLLGSGSAKICGGTLKLTATYNRLTNNTADRYEFLNLKQPQLSEYGYRYNLLTFQGDYSHKIPTWGKHAFGFYLGYTDNRMSLDNPTNAAAQNVNGDNKWAEAYYSLSVERDKLSINGGLRGRFERNSSNEDASEKKTLSYTTLAPKLSLGYSFARDYILTASYALFYDLPTFRQINPALRLSNLIFYSQGNPDLKPAYTNRFNVTANIRDFTVMAEYYDSHRNIFNVTEPYTDGTFIKYPANMRRTSDFLLSAEYTATPVRGLRLYGRVLGVCSNLRYLYNSKLVKTTDYSMEMDFNAAYRFRKFSTFVNGQYNSPQKVDTRRLSYRFSLNVGADCSLLNGKLYLRLEAQDIFRRSVTPSWDEYSPMLHQYRVNRYDTRGLSFTVRYKFTTAKTGFKQATAPVDANRLE